MTLATGTRLGPYEILSLLGAGGMGEVHRARDERLKRGVAIKVLPASYSQDADRLRRFGHEAQAAAQLADDVQSSVNRTDVVNRRDVGVVQESNGGFSRAGLLKAPAGVGCRPC